MATHDPGLEMNVLGEAAARSERMPFCAEREAASREREGKCTRALDLIIRAGVQEAITTLDLEGRWLRNHPDGGGLSR